MQPCRQKWTFFCRTGVLLHWPQGNNAHRARRQRKKLFAHSTLLIYGKIHALHPQTHPSHTHPLSQDCKRSPHPHPTFFFFFLSLFFFLTPLSFLFLSSVPPRHEYRSSHMSWPTELRNPLVHGSRRLIGRPIKAGRPEPSGREWKAFSFQNQSYAQLAWHTPDNLAREEAICQRNRTFRLKLLSFFSPPSFYYYFFYFFFFFCCCCCFQARSEPCGQGEREGGESDCL